MCSFTSVRKPRELLRSVCLCGHEDVMESAYIVEGDRRPLRLLQVVDSLDVGGAERHAVGLATALVREGHAVTLTCSVNGALASSAEAAGVTARPLLGRLVKRRLSLPFALRLAC